ncbi:MAG: response regulator transcription factor, partial [Bacteroidia bacterium]|nr:response regulator transcription factor [Bacteroidia bacterium]
ISSVPKFEWSGSALTMDELEILLSKKQPHVLLVDQTATEFASSLVFVRELFPLVTVMAINNNAERETILTAFDDGATSYLLKECDRDEIIDAIKATAARERFLCGKIADCLLNDKPQSFTESSRDFVSCDGARISQREMEIIRLIAEGYNNKEIADELSLSAHTVTTHRKNIMGKLHLNNTAGLVMYAIRNNMLDPNKYLFS